MDKYGRRYSTEGFISLMRQRDEARAEVRRLKHQSPACLVSELEAAERRAADLSREIDQEIAPRG